MKRLLLFVPVLFSPLAVSLSHATPIFWDGTATGGWDTAANWSTAADSATPDPSAPPGASDIATFNITGANSANSTVTISLNANQAADGLQIDSAGTVNLLGGGTNRTLSLGASGINTSATSTVLNIGSTTSGQNVNLSLTASQSWLFNGSNTANRGIFVNNGVSLGVSGANTLTLGGSSGSTSVSAINGVISDGAGTLSLTINGASANRWNLTGTNTYSGTTTITQGALGITNAAALGATTAGTNVASGAALFLRNTNTVVYNAEPLSIAGVGPTASARGALRQVGAGASTWTGPITADATAGAVRIGADSGSLTISGNISTTGSNAIDFEASGNIIVNGTISGSVSVQKTTGGGGAGTGTGVLTLGGTQTYSGNTTVNVGALSVTGTLANTAAVTVAAGATLRGSGTINSAASVTVNGGISGGANFAAIGTLTTGALSLTSSATYSLDINTGPRTADKLVVNGDFSLASGASLSLTDLGSSAIMPIGTSFTIVDYTGTWNGGLFSFGGTSIADDVGTFTFGPNTFSLNYNGGPNSNDVIMQVVIPEPSVALTLIGGLGLLGGLPRLRRRP